MKTSPAHGRAPLKVLISVDTEVTPYAPDWRETNLSSDTARDIDGETPDGRFGIDYQMEVLNANGLKASFFVEALWADVVGPEKLRTVVTRIQAAGHEVQLHLHPEWLRRGDLPLLKNRFGDCMKDFDLADQTALVARGLANLNAAGASDICAFRAGDYGANLDTLHALAANLIPFDTSYNLPYVGATCAIAPSRPVVQPVLVNGIIEFPVAWFYDRPGHSRHAQLCACSSAELRGALEAAWRQGWHSFVIVSHSFELITGRRRRHAKPDWVVIRRLESLCKFLSSNADKFRTVGFCDLRGMDFPTQLDAAPISSPITKTMWRYAEQALRRVS